MAFEIPKMVYTGAIKDIKLGKGDKAVTVGGETAYPFYLFEGEMPHPPRIAMEVYDAPPEEWPEAALEPGNGAALEEFLRCLKDDEGVREFHPTYAEVVVDRDGSVQSASLKEYCP